MSKFNLIVALFYLQESHLKKTKPWIFLTKKSFQTNFSRSSPVVFKDLILLSLYQIQFYMLNIFGFIFPTQYSSNLIVLIGKTSKYLKCVHQYHRCMFIMDVIVDISIPNCNKYMIAKTIPLNITLTCFASIIYTLVVNSK